MDMQPVNSSRISSVGWENNTLYVQFPDGALYAYDDVSRQEYESFMSAPSLGSELSRLDKRHPYRRIG